MTRKKSKRPKQSAVYRSVNLDVERVEDLSDSISLDVTRAKRAGMYQGMILNIVPLTHPAYDAQCAIAKYLGEQHEWGIQYVGDVSLHPEISKALKKAL